MQTLIQAWHTFIKVCGYWFLLSAFITGIIIVRMEFKIRKEDRRKKKQEKSGNADNHKGQQSEKPESKDVHFSNTITLRSIKPPYVQAN